MLLVPDNLIAFEQFITSISQSRRRKNSFENWAH